MNFSEENINQKLKTFKSPYYRFSTKLRVTILKIVLLVLLFLVCISSLLIAGMVKSIIDNAPDLSTLNVTPSAYSSTIYDNKGDVIATLVQSGSNREEASYSEIPQNLINAFVAIEDERFWTHNGVDIKGIFRATFIGLRTGNFSEGASTITQQLIKNSLFNGGAENSFGEKLKRKIQEQYLAVKLEQIMSKELIMQNYLNTINLGNNCLGVKMAAKRYFNKELSDLTLSECTVIAAVAQNPVGLNPITKPEKNKKRRDTILQYMLEQNKISENDYNEAMADDVYSRIQNISSDTSTTSSVYPFFVESLIDELSQDLQTKLGYTETQAYNALYSGGLSIYTTMDSDIQRIVDKEVNNSDNYPDTKYSFEYSLVITHQDQTTSNYTHKNIISYFKEKLQQEDFELLFNTKEESLKAVQEFKSSVLTSGDTVKNETIQYILEPQASMVIMDQSTGKVLALTGARGEKTANRVLNRATDSLRQPGSCFKVLSTFAPALDTCGASLASVYYDAPYTYNGKQFSNWWNTGYVGYANIRQAIAYSMNLVTMRCFMNTVTPNLGYEYLTRFGFTSLIDNEIINGERITDKVPALCLGGIYYGVNNLELTAAYATIANNGIYNEPVLYTKVVDHDGKILLDKTPKSKRVIKESTANLLTMAMENTMKSESPFAEYGILPTGEAANFSNMTLAGKSGSTTDFKDLWFTGYSPYYTATIWSGYDSNAAMDAGQDYHKIIWKKVMEQIHTDLPNVSFPISDDLIPVKICSKSGLLAVDGICDHEDSNGIVYVEYFDSKSVPTEYCNYHIKVSVCTASNQLATEFCPAQLCEEHVYSQLSANILALGETDDCKYLKPDSLNIRCSVHSDGSVVGNAELNTSQTTESADTQNSSKLSTNTDTTESTAKNSSTKTESTAKDNATKAMTEPTTKNTNTESATDKTTAQTVSPSTPDKMPENTTEEKDILNEIATKKVEIP